jgi:hypothetical protein
VRPVRQVRLVRGTRCRWSPSFERASQLGPEGALLIGEASEVADKILHHSETLGGIARVTFQMNAASLPQEKMLRAIETIGARVAPVLHGVT